MNVSMSKSERLAKMNLLTSPTVPLKIGGPTTAGARTRQDTVQTQLARRQSSSYNHVRTNNLVTNSPFKKRLTKIPTPRKVSNDREKERVGSRSEEENEEPLPLDNDLGFKRKQSRGFQGLQKEQPVSKSPFLNKQLPATPSRLTPSANTPALSPSRRPGRSSTPPPDPSPSPKSSLVSRRLKGPRTPAGNTSPTSTPKTVRFDERCDVVEFETPSESSISPNSSLEHNPDASLGEDEEDPNALIDSILQDTLMNASADDSLISLDSAVPNDIQTPPMRPTARMQRDEQEDESDQDLSCHSPLLDRIRERSSSPPLQRAASPETPAGAEGKGPDLERGHKRSRRSVDGMTPRELSFEAEVEQLPASPSPGRSLKIQNYLGDPIPKFELPVMEDHAKQMFDVEEDPFLSRRIPHVPSPSPSPAPTPVKSTMTREQFKRRAQQSQPVKKSPPPPPESDIDDSPLLQMRELNTDTEDADGKITPKTTESEGSGETSHESFVTASARSLEHTEHESPKSAAMEIPIQNGAGPKSNSRTGNEVSSSRPLPAPRTGSNMSVASARSDRPVSASLDFDFGQPGVEIGDMRSALDRLVIGARDSISIATPPLNPAPTNMERTRPETEAELEELGEGGSTSVSHARFDDSIMTETEEGGEMIFPTPPTTRRSPFRNSRLFDTSSESSPLVPLQDEEEEGRSITPTPTVPVTVPQLSQLPTLSFGTGLGLSTQDGEFPRQITPLSISTAATQPKSSHRASTSPPLPTPPDSAPAPITPSKSPRSLIAERQAAIAQKRREQREAELEEERERQMENDEREHERRAKWEQQQTRNRGGGRKSARRSLSTGDAGDLMLQPREEEDGARMPGGLLGVTIEESSDLELGSKFLRRESTRRKGVGMGLPKERKYQLVQKNVIYASSDDKVTHLGSVGDVDHGRAWRAVRRPSDMNEYSRQIKDLRSQEKPGKAYGKVFVKVLGIRLDKLPLPSSKTAFTCTLNNGIHFVTTPECLLGKEAKIDQEFELIEHSKLEFTLTLKARRDPHILALLRNANAPRPAAPSPPPVQQATKTRRLGIFGSPKKSKAPALPAARPAVPVYPEPETFGRYMKDDGSFGRAFVSFKEIAARCDTTLFETSFPLVGHKSSGGGDGREQTVTIGEMVFQIFRLPPLPGVTPEQLPQSLEECIRGLRHVNWHKVTYHEGTLTQNGGDCSTWRRRRLRVIGASLVAFNDVTKKPIATIDLRKAIGVEDDQDEDDKKLSEVFSDGFDALYGVERSFKLLFPKEESIAFFADNDEEKAKWLEVLRALVGHIPPNPLWAELVWQKHEGTVSVGNLAQPTRPDPAK